MVKISLRPPRTDRNKILLSWEPNLVLKGSSYWVQYLNLSEINATPQALMEAYLPVCLAFCALGEVEIVFPYPFDRHVLESWTQLFKNTSKKLFRNRYNMIFTSVADGDESAVSHEGKETALLFGGGSESLLTLALLREKNISPYLASVWGSHWPGSDLELNRARYDLEERISSELKLRMFRISTNFRDLFVGSALDPYLSRKGNFLNAALFLPMNLSFLYPVAQQLGLDRIVSGNEKESSEDIGYYSLSSDMTRDIRSCSRGVEYYSYLESLRKVDVVQQLQLKYPEMGRHQYSCWRSVRQRWCLTCEKCLRIYAILKIYDIPPIHVGMDEGVLLANLPSFLPKAAWAVVSSRAEYREWRSIWEEARRLNKEGAIAFARIILNKYYLRRLRIFFERLWESFRALQPVRKLQALLPQSERDV